MAALLLKEASVSNLLRAKLNTGLAVQEEEENDRMATCHPVVVLLFLDSQSSVEFSPYTVHRLSSAEPIACCEHHVPSLSLAQDQAERDSHCDSVNKSSQCHDLKKGNTLMRSTG